MTNQQILITIADYSRVELTPPNIEEIAEELKDFNILEFKNFVKFSLDRVELQYTPKGLERFMKFVSLYKKEINAEREAKAQTQSQILDEKFYKVMNLLDTEVREGRSPELENLQVSNEKYFKPYEIEQLNSIGNINYLISLCKSHKLQEKIEQSFMKLIYEPKHIAVANNRNVSALLGVKRI